MREGTRKSRAPSGDDAVRIGVENSKKPGLRHALPDRRGDRQALHDVLVQGLATKIEEAVLQAQVFRVVRLAEYRHRQLLGRRQHLDLGGEQLHLAGRQLGVDRALGARAHLSVDADHPFGAHRLRRLEGGAVGIGDDLRDAVVIAQVDEQQAAVVAYAVHPARQAHAMTDVGRAQSPAGVRAIAVQPGATLRRLRLTSSLRLSHRAARSRAAICHGVGGKSARARGVVKDRRFGPHRGPAARFSIARIEPLAGVTRPERCVWLSGRGRRS